MKKLIFAVYFILIPLIANSATINVSSYGDGTCSKTNFESAYAAASAGDTILFPASGSCTWSDSTTISKAITINGNGTTLTSGASLGYGFFYITGTDSSFTTTLMRITGFTFTGTSITQPGRMIYTANVSLSKLRIDHNTFNHGSTQLEIGGAFGVIDNNYCYNGGNWLLMSAGSRAQADASWVDLTPGTANALFVENNKFIIDANWKGTGTNGDGIDAYQGGKFVFRYNELDGDAMPWSKDTVGPMYSIGFHGNAAAGASPHYWQANYDVRRSPSVFEIYNNNFHGKRIDWIMTMRGGSGLIYNNTHTNSYGAARVYLREEEYYNFSPVRVAWPAEDQVHNTFIWGNTTQGVAMTSVNIVTDANLTQDRDYFLHAPCGASDTVDAYGNTCTHGKATFTGANGASNTYPTDGSTLPTEGTMIFTATGDNAYYGYVPYTYPHPLRGETDTTPPEIFSPTPSGEQVCTAARTVSLGVTTNESATCRYSLSDVSYNLMTNFSSTGGTSHSTSVNVACGSSYTYYTRCQDTSGNANTSSTEIEFTTEAAPTVTITAPTNGASLLGTNTITATCATCAGVTFYRSGTLLDGTVEDTSSPFLVSWNTALVPNAQYHLFAYGRLASGTIGISSGIDVTVSNPVGQGPHYILAKTILGKTVSAGGVAPSVTWQGAATTWQGGDVTW